MRTDIAEVLIDIEAQLRQLNLWQRVAPPEEALASTEPFCVDTLSLPQWLHDRTEYRVVMRWKQAWGGSASVSACYHSPHMVLTAQWQMMV